MWSVCAGFYHVLSAEGLTEDFIEKRIWDLVAFFEGGVDYHNLMNDTITNIFKASEHASRIAQKRNRS